MSETRKLLCRTLNSPPGGGGLLVNYSQLPGAVESAIFPHLGISVDADERALMREGARMDAKAPGQVFVGDSDAKQKEATARLRELAERHLAPVYRSLEELRRAQP